jgi:DNA-binding NarL/FixJ family response regulator
VRTVANQIAAVLRKLGVTSRNELAVRFARGGFDLDPGPR